MFHDLYPMSLLFQKCTCATMLLIRMVQTQKGMTHLAVPAVSQDEPRPELYLLFTSLLHRLQPADNHRSGHRSH